MCDDTQTAWSTGIIIGRYILVTTVHYKYDGLHSDVWRVDMCTWIPPWCRLRDVFVGCGVVDFIHRTTERMEPSPNSHAQVLKSAHVRAC